MTTTEVTASDTPTPPAVDPARPLLSLKRVAIDTYRENVAYMHRDCAVYRAEGFQALSKVEVTANGRRILASLNVVDDTCIDCPVCANVCPTDAITRDLQPDGGVRLLLKDEPVLDWVRRIHARTQWTTSVCTGSLVLAAAGLLKGYRSACHWSVRDELAAFGATPVAERVVRDRNRLSGGGVTAGIDFGLTLAAELAPTSCFPRTLQSQPTMVPSSLSPRSSNLWPPQQQKQNSQDFISVPRKWSRSATPWKKWVGRNPNHQSKLTTPPHSVSPTKLSSSGGSAAANPKAILLLLGPRPHQLCRLPNQSSYGHLP